MSGRGFSFRLSGLSGSSETFTVHAPNSFTSFQGLRIENAAGAIVKLDPQQMAEAMAAAAALERADPVPAPSDGSLRFRASAELRDLRNDTIGEAHFAAIEIDRLRGGSVEDFFEQLFARLDSGALATIGAAGAVLGLGVAVPVAVLGVGLSSAFALVRDAHEDRLEQALWAATEIYAQLALGTPGESPYRDRIPAETRAEFEGRGLDSAIDHLSQIVRGETVSLDEMRRFEDSFLNTMVLPDLALQLGTITANFRDGRDLLAGIEAPEVGRLAFLSDAFLDAAGRAGIFGAAINLFTSFRTMARGFATRDAVDDFRTAVREVDQALDTLAQARFFDADALQLLQGIGAALPLVGTEGDDVLLGSQASDRIYSAGGTDRIAAGAGNDRITLNGPLSGTYSVDGGSGTDHLVIDGAEDQFTVGDLSHGRITGPQGVVIEVRDIESVTFLDAASIARAGSDATIIGTAYSLTDMRSYPFTAVDVATTTRAGGFEFGRMVASLADGAIEVNFQDGSHDSTRAGSGNVDTSYGFIQDRLTVTRAGATEDAITEFGFELSLTNATNEETAVHNKVEVVPLTANLSRSLGPQSLSIRLGSGIGDGSAARDERFYHRALTDIGETRVLSAPLTFIGPETTFDFRLSIKHTPTGGQGLGGGHPHAGTVRATLRLVDVDDGVTVTSQSGVFPGTMPILDQELEGGQGDDVLAPTGTTERVDGGPGVDTVDFSAMSRPVEVDLRSDSYSFGDPPVTGILRNVERIAGSAFDDQITGDRAADSISGGRGDDSLHGGGGNDRLDGGAGADRLRGGAGVDLLRGNAQEDRLFGGDDNDTLFGGQGQDRLFGGGGADRLHGGTQPDLLYGGAESDRLSGAAGNDTLYGEQGDDLLFGEGQSDHLFGQDGNDTLHGGSGGDRLRGGNGLDQLYGGGQQDVLYGESQSDRLLGQNGNDTLFGGQGDDQLFGNAGADRLRGGGCNDLAYGGNGSDRIYGQAGDDRLFGGQGQDRLFGNTGSDELRGGGGNDLAYGGNQSDRIYGQGGDDRLFGGQGQDRLFGGAGNDRLTGGSGNDRFVFVDGFGDDVIIDFDALNGAERINLSAVTAITGFTDLQNNHLGVVSGTVTITDGADSVALLGVNLADLDADDFLF